MGTNFGHFSWDDDPVGVDSHRAADPTVLATLHHQSELLERLVERLLTRLDHRSGDHDNATENSDQDVAATAGPSAALPEALAAENDQLRRQIEHLRRELQHTDPSPVRDPEPLRGATAVHEAVDRETGPEFETRPEVCEISHDRQPEAAEDPPQPAAATTAMELTWEQRKQQIFEQLDREAVDTESFLSALHEELEREDAEAVPAPSGGVAMAAAEINTLEDAIAQLDALREECRRQSDTVEHYKRQAEQYFEELQHLKRQTPAAVGDEVGEDQAIRAERARLAELQSECEQQVRDLEIRSSLERAKLSRENSELRQHIEELQRQVKDLEKQVSIEGGGRRWMAKLGLNGEEPSE